ncbi:MAG: heavy metal-associated domain-containing protein [Gemmatimonadota bacterium]|mgnify:CR=1 FL=1|nr:heavy metal-associated domain-containing protein [Gemmatimonadota bacterium]
MTLYLKLATVALAGAAALCPLCGAGAPSAAAQAVAIAQQVSDTTTVKLHISGMTCGSCPATARVALKKLPGVLTVVVTLDDSLGVVRYDPRKVTPAQITAHLTRLTGYGARMIAEPAGARR